MYRFRNLFKMDLRRMIKSKPFYIMLGIAVFVPLIMLITLDLTDSTTLLGPISSSASTDIMSSMMSLGILSILSGIFISIFIGTDYKTGFIKNIMTVHANKYEYLISKILLCLILNASMIVIYIVTLAIGGAATGLPLQIPSFGGFILFVFEKLLTSIAFSAMFLFLNVIFRSNYGLSICGVLFLGAGTIGMGLTSLAQMFDLTFLNILNNMTVYGSGNLATLTPNVASFFTIFAVSAAWTVLYGFFSHMLLSKRDLI